MLPDAEIHICICVWLLLAMLGMLNCIQVAALMPNVYVNLTVYHLSVHMKGNTAAYKANM